MTAETYGIPREIATRWRASAPLLCSGLPLVLGVPWGMPTLSVLTYNVKLLPAHVKIGVRPRGIPRGFYETGLRGLKDEDRVTRLIKRLCTGEWDIVCLQEVYQEGARKRLADAFAAEGYNLVAHASDRDLFHEDSGLFLASKLPIVWHRFEEFAASAGSDTWSDKGVLCARIDASSRFGKVPHELYFFGTHLQSSNVHWPVRQLQLLQLQRFVRTCIGSPKPNAAAAILAGDFNVAAEAQVLGSTNLAPTAAYRSMLELLDYPRDAYRQAHAAKPGVTRDASVNYTMTRDVESQVERIDYVFSFDAVPESHSEAVGNRLLSLHCKEASVLPFESDDDDGGTRHLSDHFGVAATFVR